MPDSIFSSQSLRVLKLELDMDHILQLPSQFLASLEVLSLKFIVYDGDLCLEQWISTCCPSLKKLSLVSIPKLAEKLEINNPFIEDLTIDMANFSISHVSISAENLRALSLNLPASFFKDSFVKISGPNLRVLKWKGNPIHRIDLGNFSSLSNATLDIEHECDAHEYSFNRLVELLKSASSAKVLTLDISIVEILFTRDQVPVLFENLHHLNVRLGQAEAYHIPIIATSIKRLPNLMTLSITRKNKSAGYRGWSPMFKRLLRSEMSDYNKKHRRSKNRVLAHQVKEVEIELGEESNAVELVEYFLGKAGGLEKMTIFYPLLFLLHDINVFRRKFEDSFGQDCICLPGERT